MTFAPPKFSMLVPSG